VIDQSRKGKERIESKNQMECIKAATSLAEWGNDPHVQANMEVIREYLRRQFKGFGLTERPNAPLSYTFIMTRSSDEEYKLKIYSSELSDRRHTPERIKKRLVVDDVAGRMRGQSQGEYCTWRQH